MNSQFTIRFLWGVAAISLVIGAVMTVQSFSRLRADREQVERTLFELSRLRALASSVEEYEKARQLFEEMTVKKPELFKLVIDRSVSDYKPEESREDRRKLSDGWAVLQKEIVIRDIPLGKVESLVACAMTPPSVSGTRPPWTLSECVVRSSRNPGSVKAVLTFEALEQAR